MFLKFVQRYVFLEEVPNFMAKNDARSFHYYCLPETLNLYVMYYKHKSKKKARLVVKKK